MRNKCQEVENGQKDTAGNPIKVRICYCGTTACEKLGKNDYPLPKDFNQFVDFKWDIDLPCKTCGVPRLYQSKNCPNH